MDTKNDQTLKMGCGCSGDCCEPKKNNTLKKILFFIVVIAAVSIIIIKFGSLVPGTGSADVSKATMVPLSADSSASKCDTICTSQNSSCCGQAKK